MNRDARDRRDGGRGDAERLARAYARYAASARKRRSWSADNPGNLAIRQELVSAVWQLAGGALAGADDVLDVGCGTGWWLGHLAGERTVHAHLHGVDILSDRVSAARRHVPSATILTGDVRALPNDHSFGVVTLFTVLSSLRSHEDVQSVLRCCWSVVAPGGVLLVWEPRWPNPLNTVTLSISRRELRQGLGRASAASTRTTTLVPALARRLGPDTSTVYPKLASVRLLRTHRLSCFCRDC
jgi:2-polyprenyl-3-methyl-5-hydroxy-6-metoxy-1,4-benzoquinol methylase